MRAFRWLTANDIPARLDLRDCGWRLLPDEDPEQDSVSLAWTPGMVPARWIAFLNRYGRQARRLVLLIGIDDAVDRAHLLRAGFGDVTPGDLQLPELEARAARLTELENTLPRFREVGPISLDLLAREAYCDDRPLGLHPREFGLMWRLSDMPGRAVGKRELVRDVWRLGFVPETNSLAVHVSRLRGKLNVAGLGGMVRTAPAGGYLLDPAWEDQDATVQPRKALSAVRP